MSSLWPWAAVAAAGALHGLNPASGWMFAAAAGARAGRAAVAQRCPRSTGTSTAPRGGERLLGAAQRGALRALLPVAVGHVASIALVAGGVALGLRLGREEMLALAGGLFVVALARRACHTGAAARARLRGAALALWSFAMSTLHGAGLMLVPAMLPLCVGAPSRGDTAPGMLAMALAAAGVHAAAMLAASGAMAVAACRAWGSWGARVRRRARSSRPERARAAPT